MTTTDHQLASSVVPDDVARAVVLPASYADLDGVVYPASEWLRRNAPVADRLMCLFVSGNRDEDVFADPMSFDVTRRPNPHLSFSFGPHVCLGQHIAKIEMRALFDELVPRLGSVELAGEPRLKVSNFVSGFKSLPIRFTKA